MSSNRWKAVSSITSTSTRPSDDKAIGERMIDTFFTQMQIRYGGLWTREQAPNPESERINKLVWLNEFKRRKLNWRQVREALTQADTQTMPFPTLAAFLGLLRCKEESERGRASYRTVDEVMTGVLPAPPATPEEADRRKKTAKAHMRALLADF